jgi:hypothetical protein
MDGILKEGWTVNDYSQIIHPPESILTYGPFRPLPYCHRQRRYVERAELTDAVDEA